MKQKGFTLIELMIVIAIISILATMAIPSYQDRVIRTQVKEAFTVAAMVQEGVEEYYKVKGSLPRNNAEAGVPESDKIIGNYVTSVQVNNGAIDITLGNRINKNAAGKIISLRPAIVKDEPKVPIAWVPGYATVPEGMTVNGTNNSTILPRLLPVFCRI